MCTIVIKSDNEKNLRLLKAITEQMGNTVNKLSPAETEDLYFALMMKKEVTGNAVARQLIFKHLES